MIGPMPKMLRPLAVALLMTSCSQPPAAPAPAASTASPGTTAPVAAPHPLNPLTNVEIEAAAKIIRQAPQWPETGRVCHDRAEGAAEERCARLHAGRSRSRGRRLRSCSTAAATGRSKRSWISSAARIVSWTEVKGVQPAVLEAEYDVLVALVKSDPAWQAAMRKRGINDFAKVQIDDWAVGTGRAAVSAAAPAARASPISKAARRTSTAGPIEGVVALVDMNAEKVVEVVDTGVVPLPPPSQELDEKSTGVRAGAEAARHHAAGRRELHDQRPGDPLAEVALPLHDAPARGARAAHGRLRGRRTACGRSSIAPRSPRWRCRTATPISNWRWRSAFDVGEYGMGRLASSIEPNTDAPANATLIDATFAGDDGKPYVVAARRRHLRARRRHAVEALRRVLEDRTSRAARGSW